MSSIDCDGLVEDHVAACHYPGIFDASAIEASLREYLRKIGADGRVARLTSLHRVSDHPSLERQVHEIVRRAGSGGGLALQCSNAILARDSLCDNEALDFLLRDGTPASDAFDAFVETRAGDDFFATDAHVVTGALDAASDLYLRAVLRSRNTRDFDAHLWMRLFARWCVQFAGSRGQRTELYRLAYTYIAAVQNDATRVTAWSRPLFDAFVSGCWMLHRTADTLYWVAKPTVHVELGTGSHRRLHKASGPALESDVENVHVWHGVMVPARVVTHPQSIAIDEIDRETNTEVRRVLIERYGTSRYLRDSSARVVQSDASGLLYCKELPDDEPIVMVRVLNATPEPDGVMSREEAIEIFGGAAQAALNAPEGSRFKDYMLRVPPYFRTAHEAVAWTFGLEAKAYHPTIES